MVFASTFRLAGLGVRIRPVWLYIFLQSRNEIFAGLTRSGQTKKPAASPPRATGATKRSSCAAQPLLRRNWSETQTRRTSIKNLQFSSRERPMHQANGSTRSRSPSAGLLLTVRRRLGSTAGRSVSTTSYAPAAAAQRPTCGETAEVHDRLQQTASQSSSIPSAYQTHTSPQLDHGALGQWAAEHLRQPPVRLCRQPLAEPDRHGR